VLVSKSFFINYQHLAIETIQDVAISRYLKEKENLE